MIEEELINDKERNEFINNRFQFFDEKICELNDKLIKIKENYDDRNLEIDIQIAKLKEHTERLMSMIREFEKMPYDFLEKLYAMYKVYKGL